MWIIFALCVLLISGVVGLHLGRFREAYTEMTGMMAGMTMGMLNGFLLGYAAGAGTISMFWGNLFGVLLGLMLGVYFGRAGGLMGILDGGMGGVMGGSMGAMLAVMVAFPPEAIYWTALLLAGIYLVGILGLVALMEQSAPEHAAMHRVLPMFTRAMSTEAAEEIDANRQAGAASSSLQITDYYAFLGISHSATAQEIGDAYLTRLASSDEADTERAELALATLTNPRKREIYDRRLEESRATNSYNERGDCCPPPRRGLARQAPTVETSLPARKLTTPARTSTVKLQQRAPSTVRRVASPPEQKEAPISWIGVLAGVVTVVMLAAWWLVSQGGGNVVPATANPSQLEAQAVVAPIADDGKQTLDFVVNGFTRSYEPKAIKVKKGVPVHFNVSHTGPDAGCSKFIAIRDLDVHGEAVRGQSTHIDFTPTRAGIFEINCEMQMTPPSYLIVTE
ncbi:MAG TPA: cupredoxin domain-containing protein [Chloroflexia bacterium]|nr:cupredoxin domain-containing protein [Chloroflexia bacterium]